ncbi:MAG: hypothetical protein HZA22_04735 [Nitrospirae bacterium]|nr:hypothetical protein [Nitrospirota bacterium]
MTLSVYDENKVALSRQELLFAAKEAAGAFGVIVEPVGADLIPLTGIASFKQDTGTREDKRVRDSRSPRSGAKGRTPAGSLSFPMYLMPSGTPGTAPPGDKVLEAIFGTKTTRAADTVQASPAATINSFKPATLSNYLAGQPVAVLIGTHVEIRLITSVDTAVHVAPDFSAIPATGAAAYAAVGYTLADNVGSLSLWHKKGHTVKVYPGSLAAALALAFDGENEVMPTVSGKYQREVVCGTFKLASDIDGTADPVTATVDDGNKVSVGARFNITDGTFTETKCIVTGISGDSVTFTRGTGKHAFTASGGVECTPWLPTGVEAGSVVEGRRGAAYLNGVAVDIIKLEVNIDQKVKPHENEATSTGADYFESYSTPGGREVKGSLDVYFRQKHAGLFRRADNLTAQAIWKPAFVANENGYPVAGKAVVFIVSSMRLAKPDFSEDDGEVVLNTPILPDDDTGSNKEVSLWFL